MTNKKTMKTIVFSLGLAAMTLAANNLNAQNDGSRGLFGMGASPADNQYGNSEGSMLRQGDPTDISGGLTNQTFETPLGGGIAILLAAGLGYVALKKKEDE
jgi:hypothetical protein